MENRFYVYVLFRPDGQPCYVGKGKGNRWTNHERYGSSNLNLQRIIKNAGGILPKAKIKENMLEKDAFELEISLIRSIGRKIHGGLLVNFTDGGEGPSGCENHWNGLTHPETANVSRDLLGHY